MSLVVEGAKFCKGRRLQSGETHWRCVNKFCRAKLHVNSDNKITKSDLEHSHDVKVETLNRHKISNSVKRKAEDDISTRPSKLIHQELKGININCKIINLFIIIVYYVMLWLVCLPHCVRQPIYQPQHIKLHFCSE
jgi:hypothetical protein